ncbi:hypothetical protein [Planctomyces sp. SH-PL14]|uniref:hypothetical protein n=1 Tax=Planctomyces sp. SH-PL14 TaxID=1632864 RepID=UPI00078CDC7A|nr:hypothetical protein [Planctomyces sp. SH-PL14]AMV21784.1 hypothetical protein VT03_28035 [Planctomyces sp. SH-PL14]
MWELVVNRTTWYWLARLRVVPMRVANSADEVGPEMVAKLIRLKLVKCVQGEHRLTALGAQLIDAAHPPMLNGDRVLIP